MVRSGLTEELAAEGLILRRQLELYLEPGPGDSLFDLAATGASGATGSAATPLVSYTTKQGRGLVLAGIATGPTAFLVKYQLLVNGNSVLDSDHQLTDSLYVLLPVRLVVAQGPVTVEMKVIGAAASVNAAVRIHGWALSGDDVRRGRVVR